MPICFNRSELRELEEDMTPTWFNRSETNGLLGDGKDHMNRSKRQVQMKGLLADGNDHMMRLMKRIATMVVINTREAQLTWITRTLCLYLLISVKVCFLFSCHIDLIKY